MQYRIHIDMPMGEDQEDATKKALGVIGILEQNLDTIRSMGIESIGYRLGHDEDRQKSNYLSLNDNGHCSNKKLKIPVL